MVFKTSGFRMLLMGGIEALTDDLRYHEARREAERRLKEEFSERNFLSLLSLLLTVGDMKATARYLRLWRDLKGDYPESFTSYLALFYMRTLDVENLVRVLPKLRYGERAIVYLNVFADPLSAWKLSEREENPFLREKVRYDIGTIMGMPYPLPSPKSEFERLVLDVSKSLRYLTSGKMEEGLRLVDGVVDRAVNSGVVIPIISIKARALLLRGKLSEIHLLRLATESLGLKKESERLKIYEYFLGGEVEINTERLDRRLKVDLDLSRRAKRRMLPPEETSPHFGIEAFWWYVSKVRSGSPYLSFSGRLRLMRGLEEVRLPRRRALVLLAFVRLKGYRFARENARIIFPESRKPQRRVAEYMRYVREYLNVPMDVRIARRFQTFLKEEGEEWAGFLREHVLNV